MSDIQIFNNDEFGQVRTLKENGDIWFVAKDVCKALDLSNTTVAVNRLDLDERSKLNLGRQGLVNCVNEFGLYNLVLGSRKKEARKFKRWITHEVIPSIRKTGSYSVDKPNDDLAMIENLNNQISHVVSHIRKQDKELEETKEKQEELQERVDSLDAVNLEGDLRQRLNQMVRKYAYESGEGFGKAWSEFKRRFNIAYNTNIELLKTNYQKETGQEIITPGILEERDRLEDAIRVANKMINKAS